MTALDHDLARWEAGELSGDQLRRLHPDAEVVSLIDLHARLSALGEAPVRFSEGEWESLRGRLPARLRRLEGKSDIIDAEAAARTVLSGKATGVPKSGDGRVEMIRSLRVARRSAMKARTQAANQLHALVITCPASLRCRAGRRRFPHPRGRPISTARTVEVTGPRTTPVEDRARSRMRYDERTRHYVERRTQEGLSKKEIIRCLKCYVAREVYRCLARVDGL